MPCSIRFGDSSHRVRLLQHELHQKGLLSNPDGSFGLQTQVAVKQFQESANVEIDGIVGKQTWGLLMVNKFPTPFKLPLGRLQAEFIFNNSISPSDLTLLNNSMQRFDIATPHRARHFLAQLAHESGGLVHFEEIHEGDDYEGRLDLGNTEPGDGRRYRGIDPIQTTGRFNYQRLADYLGDQRVMEGFSYVRDNVPRFLPSGFWWYDNKVNGMIDNGATCREVSARVNGCNPANGLEEREDYYDIAEEVIRD